MKLFQELYLELAQMITDKLPAVQWVDLWHNQVNFLEDEHPFPAPAVFMQFFLNQTNDLGELLQEAQLQVDFYLFYETFADTDYTSHNREEALEFLSTLDSLQTLFHGVDGEVFQNMKRVRVSPEDTGNAGHLYKISFVANFVDPNAIEEKKYTEKGIKKAFEAFQI